MKYPMTMKEKRQRQAPLLSEQKDNLARSTKKVKMADDVLVGHGVPEAEVEARQQESRMLSYRDLFTQNHTTICMEEQGIKEDEYEDDDVTISDDDMVNDEDDMPCLSNGMRREEKKQARKPWQLSVIMKLVGKTIGYHYLLRYLHTLWRPLYSFSLIDLPNRFFIVKFYHRSDYDIALM